MLKRILFTFTISLLIIFLVWYGIRNILVSPKSADVNATLATATLIAPPKPLLDFSLTDTQNKSFNAHSLRGFWTLLFFGYSQCPDICPNALNKINDTWQILDNVAKKTGDSLKPRFIFISLSPKDTIQGLQNFLGRFNPEFIGAKGIDSEISNLSKACSIYSYVDPHKTINGQKIIDHSASFVLINPLGQIHAFFSPPHHPELIAKDLSLLMKP